MKKLISIILFVHFISIHLFAQNIDNWIDSKKPILFEKLYIHVDRELYAPGDKIWMKIYEVNGMTHQLNSNFRNVFVQLVSEDGQVVKDMVLFTIKGQAHGDFTTESIPSGKYTIRAYTKYLENFGEEAFFHKKIWITKSLKIVDKKETDQPDYSHMDLSFFPEGGNLIRNALNTVAFKAIDSNGKGIFVSGKIVNDSGDTITSFTTAYRGMGKFLLMPQDGANYYAICDQFPERKIELPQAVELGIGLNYKENGSSLLFGMSGNMKVGKHMDYYFVASHKGVVLFYKKLEMTDFTQSLNLSKNLFPQGISKISILDLSLNQIAERLIFVDDGRKDLLNLELNQNEFKSRQEVKLNIEAKLSPGDSLLSSLSVAVVSKTYFNSSGNSQTIKSYLLLDSELKGAIESPASYFIDDDLASSGEKLDLLMMIQGWRSYLWNDIEAGKPGSLTDWNDAGINIKGYVKKLLHESPIAGGKVVLGPAGGNFLIEETTTDSVGRFEFSHMFLYDSTEVMINAKNKHGNRNTEIRLDPVFKLDSLLPQEALDNTSFDIEPHRNFYQMNYYRRMKEMGFNPEKGSILLSEVEVVEDHIPKDATQFKIYQEADNSFTIRQEDYQYNNIFEFLEGKVAGLMVTGNGISIRGGGMPLFFIDGFEVSDFPPGEGRVLQEILSLHMNEIEKIEILKNAGNLAVYGSKGANGVIAIYRTSGDYTGNIERYIRGRIIEKIKGFNRPSAFYSQKYSLENQNDPAPDFRPTLYWNPDLIFSEGKANLDFFTSDEKARYVIFVEGISKNGKICFGTTDFSVGKN